MKSFVIGGLVVFSALFAAASDCAEMKAKIERDCKVQRVDKFHGFDRIVFDFKGYEAWVVCPEGETRAGCPWTWTMQWATAYVPRTNVPKMLKDGYHHVTINTFERRMDDAGVAVSADFQKFLVERLGFAPKAFLIGMSWGGFFSVRYATAHPENVAKIYLDCPLLNFQGFIPKAAPTDTAKRIGPWAQMQPANGNWMDDPRMPINMAAKLAAAKLPVLLIYGGYDLTLDPELNSRLFAARFKDAGGDLTVVYRPLYGHHPHGVEVNETTIKDFFER